MSDDVFYKIDQQVMGPRPLREIRREIRSGRLPSSTPVQLASDRIWTDLEGLEKQRYRGIQVAFSPRRMALFFLAANATIAGIGYFWWGAFFVSGALCLFLGVLIGTFEDGRRQPFNTAVQLLAACLRVASPIEEPDTGPLPIVRWLVLSGFLHWVVFFIFVSIHPG